MSVTRNFNSRRWRLNHLYKIIDKKGQAIDFKMNISQEQVYDLKLEHKRLVILKGRQLGITTLECIDKLDRALLYSNQNLVITAHNQEKQKEIFQKVKYAYEHMLDGHTGINLEDGTKWYKPTTKYDNTTELFFSNNSRITVTLNSRG